MGAREAPAAALGGSVRLLENAYIRQAPGVGGAALGVAKRADCLPFGGRAAPNGWLSVRWRGQIGWVSGTFGRLEG